MGFINSQLSLPQSVTVVGPVVGTWLKTTIWWTFFYIPTRRDIHWADLGSHGGRFIDWNFMDFMVQIDNTNCSIFNHCNEDDQEKVLVKWIYKDFFLRIWVGGRLKDQKSGDVANDVEKNIHQNWDLRDLENWVLWWFRNPVNSPVEGTVVYPIIHRALYIPGGCLGFCPPTVLKASCHCLPESWKHWITWSTIRMKCQNTSHRISNSWMEFCCWNGKTTRNESKKKSTH